MTFDSWETEDTIRKRCEKYKELLSNLGTIWSTVRGIEKGLLPTDENELQLHNAIKIGKTFGLSWVLPHTNPSGIIHLMATWRNNTVVLEDWRIKRTIRLNMAIKFGQDWMIVTSVYQTLRNVLNWCIALQSDGDIQK